jgi:hypothetical protein
MFSRTLLDWLNSQEARPWWALRKGKEICDIWLAQQLRPYGIQPRTVRIGEAVAKGYWQEDFKEVFRRYIARVDYEEFRAEFLAQGSAGAQGASQ